MLNNYYVVFYTITPWPNKYDPETMSVRYDSQDKSTTELKSAERRNLLEEYLNKHPEIEPISIYESVEYKGDRTFKSLVCWYRKSKS